MLLLEAMGLYHKTASSEAENCSVTQAYSSLKTFYKKTPSSLGANGLNHCSLTVQLLLNVDYAFAKVGFCFDLAGDFLDGIHHCGVIAPT